MTKYCPNGHPMEEWMAECPFCAKAKDGVKKILGNQTPPPQNAADAQDGGSSGLKATVVDGQTEQYRSPLKATVVDGHTEFYQSPLKETVMDRPDAKKTAVLGHEDKTRKTEKKKLPLMGWLVIMNGEDKWKDFRVDSDRLILGNSNECEIQLKDDAISGRHASIRRQPEGLVLTDLDSTNGTYLNNDPDSVTKKILQDEDLIRVGNTYLKFRRL